MHTMSLLFEQAFTDRACVSILHWILKNYRIIPTFNAWFWKEDLFVVNIDVINVLHMNIGASTGRCNVLYI